MRRWRSKSNKRWKEKSGTEPGFPTHFYLIAHVGFPIWNETERLAGKNDGCSGLFLSQQQPLSLTPSNSWARGNSCIKGGEHSPVGHHLYVKLQFYFAQEHRCETRCAGQVALEAPKLGSDLTECWAASLLLNILDCSEYQRHSASWKNVAFFSLNDFLLSQLETFLLLQRNNFLNCNFYYCRLMNNEMHNFIVCFEESLSISLVIVYVLYHKLWKIHEELACEFLY